MGTVFVKGLEISACHGVNPEEKVTPQPFVFDAEMEEDISLAAASDGLADAVNYSEVCKIITGVAQSGCFNLIEKLVWECAFAVLEKFPVNRICLTVNKPQAPMKRKFESVGVRLELKREKVCLALGSSVGDRRAALDGALSKLAATRGIYVKKCSSYIETEPYGGVAKNKFLNAAAEVETYLPPRVLLRELHRIEQECGRVREKHWDDRTLDIDIIFYGDKIICDDELTVPHPEYAKRAFVLQPLSEIVPNFVCPIMKKRVKDIHL